MTHDTEKLLGLLGLARRAGKLAMGFGAVEQLVRRGKKPLVILATDLGPSQKNKAGAWEAQAELVDDVLAKEDLAQALGREKLGVVAVNDPGFVKGIRAALAASGSRKDNGPNE